MCEGARVARLDGHGVLPAHRACVGTPGGLMHEEPVRVTKIRKPWHIMYITPSVFVGGYVQARSWFPVLIDRFVFLLSNPLF